MDVSKSIEPRSDQMNFDDVASESLTVTVTGVKQGPPDQPVHVHLAEYPDRPYKPAKSMRRVLVAVWGKDAAAWAGRSLTLYGDPTIKFGKDAVGGIRISHVSHIDKPMTVSLTITRGKRAPFTVKPLDVGPDPKAIEAALADIAGAESLPALKAAFDLAGTRGVRNVPEVVAAKDKKKEELS